MVTIKRYGSKKKGVGLNGAKTSFQGGHNFLKSCPIPSMGLVDLPTWMVDLYGRLVGKCTSPMDAMMNTWLAPENLVI